MPKVNSGPVHTKGQGGGESLETLKILLSEQEGAERKGGISRVEGVWPKTPIVAQAFGGPRPRNFGRGSKQGK